jgi:hypothetical protein
VGEDGNWMLEGPFEGRKRSLKRDVDFEFDAFELVVTVMLCLYTSVDSGRG